MPPGGRSSTPSRISAASSASESARLRASSRALGHTERAQAAALADVFRPYGVKVYLSVKWTAPMELDGLKTADPLDRAASKLQKGLRVFLRDQAPLEPVAKRLDTKGDGEVNVVLQLSGGTEVEIKLPGRFKVSPQIAGAIKAVPGVLDVQML